MFNLQHQFNNITETSQTTQLTNDQTPEFHCHCECSKCPPPAPTQAFSRLIWEVFHSLVNRSLW